MEAFDPMHPVILGNEDGPRKKLVEIDGGHGPGQLTIVDQAAPRREQLQADLVSWSSDGIKYGGHATTASVRTNRLPNILGGPVDGVVGSGSTNGFHPLAAGNTDDVGSMVGKGGHEHSTYSASGAPHHGCPSFQRP